MPETVVTEPLRHRLVFGLVVTVVVVLSITAWLPAALWVTLVARAIRAHWYLGYWPQYERPDPNSLPQSFGPVPEWVDGVAGLAALATLAAFSLFIIRSTVRPRLWFAAAALLWPVAWLAIYGVLVLDPGGVAEWAFD